MATARLGGFIPQIGFFAFLAGSLAFAAFGSNRFLSCGADSTITPILPGVWRLCRVRFARLWDAGGGARADGRAFASGCRNFPSRLDRGIFFRCP